MSPSTIDRFPLTVTIKLTVDDISNIIDALEAYRPEIDLDPDLDNNIQNLITYLQNRKNTLLKNQASRRL